MLSKYTSRQLSVERLYKFVTKNEGFKSVPLAEYLENRVDRNHIIRKVRQISLPSFESGAQNMLKKLFSHISSKNFVTETISAQSVRESDKRELSVYCRPKFTNVKNKSNLVKVMLYLEKNTFDLMKNISIEECIDTLPKNTSAGFPEFRKKGDSLAINKCIERVNAFMNLESFEQKFLYLTQFPVFIFHRFTPKLKDTSKVIKPEYKIRQIFGAPFHIIVLEKFLFYNFVESFKRSFSNWYTVGLTKLQISKSVGRIRNQAKLNKKVLFCGDIKGCDKSISLDHSCLYFKLASHFINPSKIKLFSPIVSYFMRTPILFEDGLVYKNGSTVTGSWITSSFTTISVLIPILYGYLCIYNRFPGADDLLIQGDDFVVLLDNENDKFLFKQIFSEFNLRLRLDASKVVRPYEDVEFLGFLWDYNNYPDQTDNWIISKIAYPEKFIKFDGPLRIIYRTLSIIINLKRYSELFYKILEYDPYLHNLLMSGSSCTFQLISERNEILNVKIPISEFLRLGWRLL